MADFNQLLENIKSIHLQLQESAAKAVNKLLTIRNWLIGYYIVEYEQYGEDRAKYGEKLLKNLEIGLKELGLHELSERRLREVRLFYQKYPQIWQSVTAILNTTQIRQSVTAILKPGRIGYKLVKKGQSPIAQSLPSDLMVPPDKLITKLSYTHLVQLLSVDDPIKRTFYEIESIKGNWSVRELKRQINSMYFERMGLSKDKEKLARLVKETIDSPGQPADFIKNTYLFEFLGLPKKALVKETDLEQGLLEHLQEFLLEFGNGFCLEGRQKRILIGDEYFFVDLVFYHRILKCHVLIELKVEEFTHANLGQLKAYLNYYKAEVKRSDDNPPVGILLVTNKNDALVQYAIAGDEKSLFIAKYLLKLPSKEQLEDFIRKELKQF